LALGDEVATPKRPADVTYRREDMRHRLTTVPGVEPLFATTVAIWRASDDRASMLTSA
jgi:hypothetical protein